MKTEIGEPRMFGEVVGRIVGFSEEGTVAIENNVKEICSIVLFCTPHGTVIKTGRFYLKEITPTGLARLYQHEKVLKLENKAAYNNKIKL